MIEILIRTSLVYIFIVACIRIFGKRELAQLSVVDLVFILLISNSVQNAMVGPDTGLLAGMLAASTLFLLNAGLKYLLSRNKRLNTFIQGSPVMLIYHGKVLTDHLEKQGISLDELEQGVREHGVSSTGEVDLAVLEMDGNISVLSNDYKHKTFKRRKPHKVLQSQV